MAHPLWFKLSISCRLSATRKAASSAEIESLIQGSQVRVSIRALFCVPLTVDVNRFPISFIDCDPELCQIARSGFGTDRRHVLQAASDSRHGICLEGVEGATGPSSALSLHSIGTLH